MEPIELHPRIRYEVRWSELKRYIEEAYVCTLSDEFVSQEEGWLNDSKQFVELYPEQYEVIEEAGMVTEWLKHSQCDEATCSCQGADRKWPGIQAFLCHMHMTGLLPEYVDNLLVFFWYD